MLGVCRAVQVCAWGPLRVTLRVCRAVRAPVRCCARRCRAMVCEARGVQGAACVCRRRAGLYVAVCGGAAELR